LRRASFAWVLIVAVIAALAVGVVWKAGQSASEAERANGLANQAAQEAARASSETARAEAELWNARFTEAQALRIAGGRGARSTASRIVGELSRHAGLTELQRFALRAEAIAQLALVDLDPSADFNGGIVKNSPVWDAKLERYVTETGDGDVEIVETGSGRRLATFPVPRGFKRDGVVFSPDGQFLAGVFKRSQSRVLAWRIADGALVASNLTTSANGYDKPFFSPDNRTLGIYTAAALQRVSLDASMPAREFSRPVCASLRTPDLVRQPTQNVETT
jgi:hypothetical protein